MKRTITVMMLIVLIRPNIWANHHVADNKVEIEQTLDHLKEALNQKQFALIETKLSPEFEYSGYGGDMAQMIMSQVVSQYPKTINMITITSIEEIAGQSNYRINTSFHSDSESESIEILLDENFLLFAAPVSVINMAGHGHQQSQAPPQVASKITEAVTLPFEQRGRLIFVEASVNGIKGLFFIDSGAPGMILNQSRYVDLLTDVKDIEKASHGVGGQVKGEQTATVKSFKWGPVTLENTPTRLADLSHFHQEYSAEVHGIIGADLLSQFIVDYDYSQQTITLHPLHQAVDWGQGHPEVFDVEVIAHMPVINIEVGTQVLLMGIDSGAEGAMLATKWREPLDQFMNFLSHENLNGLDNQPIVTEVMELVTFKIGGIEYNKHRFVIADIQWGHQSIIDGLLGYEFLSQQRSAIDMKNKKLYLWP